MSRVGQHDSSQLPAQPTTGRPLTRPASQHRSGAFHQRTQAVPVIEDREAGEHQLDLDRGGGVLQQRSKPVEGISENGLPMVMPAYISDVRISNGKITLYKSVQ